MPVEPVGRFASDLRYPGEIGRQVLPAPPRAAKSVWAVPVSASPHRMWLFAAPKVDAIVVPRAAKLQQDTDDRNRHADGSVLESPDTQTNEGNDRPAKHERGSDGRTKWAAHGSPEPELTRRVRRR